MSQAITARRTGGGGRRPAQPGASASTAFRLAFLLVSVGIAFAAAVAGACAPDVEPSTVWTGRTSALAEEPASPVVTISSPAAYASLALADEGPTAVELRYVATGSVAELRAHLYLDDTMLASQAAALGYFVFEDVPRGARRLSVALATTDAPGDELPGAADSVPIRVVGGCATVADCADGNPCSVDACISGRCRFGPGGSAECCASRFDCAIGPGGVRYCVDDRCRECRSETEVGDCDDADPCTADRCCRAGEAGCPVGTCAHEGPEDDSCCATDADCDDGNGCTEDRCNEAGACEHGDPPGTVCCTVETAPARCDDGNPCTRDVCIGEECRWTSPEPDCCASAAGVPWRGRAS